MKHSKLEIGKWYTSDDWCQNSFARYEVYSPDTFIHNNIACIDGRNPCNNSFFDCREYREVPLSFVIPYMYSELKKTLGISNLNYNIY